jgi:hypothetical protein
MDQHEKSNKTYGEYYYPKLTLRLLILAIVLSIIIANSIIITSDPNSRQVTTLWAMNITAATASSLGIIAVFRHGVSGLHGKSYLFLTLGLISWFCADLTLLYNYYALGIEEQKFVTVTDGFWFMGYGFLSTHLLIIVKSLRRENDNSNVTKSKFVIIGSLAIAAVFVIFNGINFISSDYIAVNKERVDLASIAVTFAYPILDLILIIPSSIVLVGLRKNYQHSIPWFLSSLSLFINAIADDGYLIDFVNKNSQHLLFWDVFYVMDFIIMAGALFWYNKFHITTSRRSRRTVEL